MTPPHAREIWREFHWAFFLHTQGMILCLRRFAGCLECNDLKGAETELETATTLMDASAAAMQLAGSFTRAEYERDIRISMTPPNVKSEGFSGLMSWEHGALVNLWRSLRPHFANLPVALQPAHAEFAAAYRRMADGHVKVCARFVGEDAISLRYGDRDALASLRRFGKSRHALINPEAEPEGTDA
ncbi:siderophore biosynthesis protein [Pseudorhodobacter turbinis]|uniref:Siderophore biosynthesis protein n=1 Tax=Pseudorhodobacter turbinis TaxID=2500533 RepID=A0A4P8EG93_9RHOB|nr:siderophore biosynthesis protein [Pseudorhodobacter turbinis]QCO55742.1 siderophore biosynthesis protein [Pseudorhodobacter turbinis]